MAVYKVYFSVNTKSLPHQWWLPLPGNHQANSLPRGHWWIWQD